MHIGGPNPAPDIGLPANFGEVGTGLSETFGGITAVQVGVFLGVAGIVYLGAQSLGRSLR